MWFCRFLVFAFLSEIIELLHGLGLNFISHVDVWFHGLVI